jgi:hypothetical protein
VHPYRVFISYSREDISLARELDSALAQLGLKPLWDPQIQPGEHFKDQIKTLISHSHLFVPLLTERSQGRPWVHQETGFAIALGIPVLPITVDRVPGEMSAEIQSLQVDPSFSNLTARLLSIDFGRIIERDASTPASLVQVAGWPEERTRLISEFAAKVMQLQGAARVRQRGTYSSFSIPTLPPEHPDWHIRDGDNPRSPYYHELQSKERQALEGHARQQGCDLIINPYLRLRGRGQGATRIRLATLLAFLEAPTVDDVKVAISNRAQGRNLTVLGDWWVAESLVPGPGGYRQTVFNWHAPTALRAIQDFDREFKELVGGVPADESRARAIELIRTEVAALDSEISKSGRD